MTTMTKPKISYREFDLMVSTGKFERRPERFELIKGRVRKAAQPGPTNEDLVDWLSYWSIENTDETQVRVRIHQSLALPKLDSLAIPDVAWLRQGNFRTRRPNAADVLLLVEVADSSLNFDTKKKAVLYAEAEIQDYWIVNIPHWRVDVFRKPINGRFTECFSREFGEVVSPLALPELSLEVSRLFNTWQR